MAIVRWNPIRDFGRMDSPLRRVFDELGHEWSSGEPSPTTVWSPSVDIYENDKEIVVKAELPGVEEKDVELSFENNILTIHGQRQMEKDIKREDYHRIESEYGTFTRSFSLPAIVDENKIRAEFRNGILKVILPRSEQTKRKQIRIEKAA